MSIHLLMVKEVDMNSSMERLATLLDETFWHLEGSVA